jgi:hypothetical protein
MRNDEPHRFPLQVCNVKNNGRSRQSCCEWTLDNSENLRDVVVFYRK